MEKYPIHIAFCINDAYAQYICVTIKSIVENHRNDDVTIHILSDYISDKSKTRIKEAISGAEERARIAYYEMDNSEFDGLRTKRNWPVCVWYRIVLPEILSTDIHRVLYLDADTLVSDNLSNLFQIDMEDESIAAVKDEYSMWGETRATDLGYDESKGYICSGVILMNLDYWRRNYLSSQMIEWAKENGDILRFPDQDTINKFCQDTKIMLPLKYAVTQYYFEYDYFYQHYNKQLNECLVKPVIVHFILKPWCVETVKKTHMSYLWKIYNKMLKHPVRITYEAKGWLQFKVRVWNMLHPFRRECLSVTEIKKKLQEYDS